MGQSKPYDPVTLADRWDVSSETIRAQSRDGRLTHFRLGNLYRIPAYVVEGVENCQTSASDDLGAGSASTGETIPGDDVISLRYAPRRKQKQKP
jgi:hypothetical protein